MTNERTGRGRELEAAIETARERQATRKIPAFPRLFAAAMFVMLTAVGINTFAHSHPVGRWICWGVMVSAVVATTVLMFAPRVRAAAAERRVDTLLIRLNQPQVR